MKITPRILLLAGMLGSVAAAWSGFVLGGGTRGSSPLPPVIPPVAAENPSAPAGTTRAPTPRHQTLFSHASARGETTSHQQAPASTKAAPSATASAGGAVPSVAEFKSSSPARQRLRVKTVEQEAPHYPLVMHALPVDFLKAQPAVAAEVDRLRDKFIDEVGGTNQNPADPVYRARWTQSVSLADDQLRAAVGWQAYNEMMAAAYYAQKAAAQ